MLFVKEQYKILPKSPHFDKFSMDKELGASGATPLVEEAVTIKRFLTGQPPEDKECSEAGLLTREVFQREGERRHWRMAKGPEPPQAWHNRNRSCFY